MRSLRRCNDRRIVLRGGDKELFIIKGANHTDLYDDRAGVIPYDKMEKFLRDNLK